jgi:DNA-directed RNA polymerase subunit RPC12/RpoP
MAWGPWGRRAEAAAGAAEGAAPAAEAAPERRFTCEQCGAILTYRPGTETLVCAYCGHVNRIVEAAVEIVENDLRAALARGLADAPVEETRTVKCGSCGAEFSFDPNVHAGVCPFCGHAAVTDPGVNRHIRPAGLLPFAIAEADARDRIADWLKGLWFAPTKLKQYARGAGRLAGMYLPYWTYDSRTRTRYTGARGTIYYEPVQVRTMVNGRPVVQTQMVQKVRWTPVAGQVARFFDDVLVLASRSLPAWITDRLEPWDLQDMRPYTEDYLSGFRSEVYQVPLDEGFEAAKEKMRAVIQGDVRADIGGDLQQIRQMEVTHLDPTFKHVLLPVWITAFTFRGRSYRLCVNGRTGEVQGERPWSGWKIAAAVLVAVIVAGILLYLFGGDLG